VNQGPTLTDDGLPAGVAEQLRAAARSRTEGSVPYPRLATAIRRDRRRRALGGAAVGVAALLAATLVTSAVRADRPAQPANRGAGPTQTPTPAPSRTQEPGPDGDPYNLAGRTAGALGRDAAWLQGMRQRVVEHGRASDAAHVRVLWAADHWQSRYAMTIAQQGAVWTLEEWAGKLGAAPSAMTYEGGRGATAAGAGARPVMRALATTFRSVAGPTPGGALVVAVGDRLSDVEIGSDFDYTADGRKTASWRPMKPEGAVWTGLFTATELPAVTVRVRAADGLRRSAGGGRRGYVDAGLSPGLVDVAPPGTDRAMLTCAASAFAPFAGGFPRGATPVLGGAAKVGFEHYGIAVARAAGGGYLVGSCPTLRPEGGTRFADAPQGFVVPAPAGGPDDLFALLQSSWNDARIGDEVAKGQIIPGPTRTAAVVVAPVGATEVEVAGTTVPVHDRLAVVRDVPEEGVTAIARDATGRELGRTGYATSERNVELESFYDAP